MTDRLWRSSSGRQIKATSPGCGLFTSDCSNGTLGPKGVLFLFLLLTRINRKSEALNSKSETNPKYKCSNAQNMESKLFEIIVLVHSVLVI